MEIALAICHREAFLEVRDVSATRLDVGMSEYIYIYVIMYIYICVIICIYIYV